MSLAAVHREDSSCVFKRWSAKSHTRIFKGEVGILLQKSGYYSLVFLLRKSAGGINHNSADFERVLCAVQNIQLPLGAALYMSLAPLVLRFTVLAEHALAAAGSVNKNPIELFRELTAQNIGVHI